MVGIMGTIYDQLRQAIQAGNVTCYRLWKDADIDQGQLSRFMAGISGLSVESVERIADCLNLEIVIRPKKRKVKQRGKYSPK